MATIYTSRVSLRDTDTGLWLYGRAYAVYNTSTTDTAVTISGTYYFEISKASSSGGGAGSCTGNVVIPATANATVTKNFSKQTLSVMPGQMSNSASIGTFTINAPRTHANQSFSVTFKAGISLQTNSSDKTEHVTGSLTMTVPAKQSWIVSYNANNGLNAPASQTKWFNETLKLQTAIPNKDGYNFRYWNTNSDGVSGTIYNSGANYTANAGATMYAVWHQNPSCSITTTSNAPYYTMYTGYSVDISSVILYDGATLSSAILQIGSQSASMVDNSITIPQLNAAGSFTPLVRISDSLGGVTDYPLSEIVVNQYTKPSITINNVSRISKVSQSGDEKWVANDEGMSALATVKVFYKDEIASMTDLATAIANEDGEPIQANVSWYTSNNDGVLSDEITDWDDVPSGSEIYALIDNSGHDAFNPSLSYQIEMTPADTHESGVTQVYTLASAFYMMDFRAGGHGVSFGMPATKDGFHCGMDAHFYNIEGSDGVVSVHLEPRNDYDWNIDHAPANNAYGTGFEIYDSANHRITNLDAHSYPSGTIATVLGVHRKVNDEHIYHQIFLYIADDGTTSYAVSNAAAFRDAIGFSKTYRQLWSGALYMTANHTAPLSQKVSEQPLGIILVWSAYSSGIQNYDFVYQFVPKTHVLRHNGSGVSQFLVNSVMTKVGSKYVYVYDDHILGHAQNDKTGTASGITYANNYWALRNVYGI